MTKEELIQRRAVLIAERDNLIAQVNHVSGRIAEIERLIAAVAHEAEAPLVAPAAEQPA